MPGLMPIEELDVYRVAEEFADAVWHVVVEWDVFAKRTLGEQLVDAADSIGANIAEGAGEASDKDQRRYLRYARRSLRETRWHLRRAHARDLIPSERVTELRSLLDRLAKLVTAFTKAVERRNGSATTCRLADSPTRRVSTEEIP